MYSDLGIKTRSAVAGVGAPTHGLIRTVEKGNGGTAGIVASIYNSGGLCMQPFNGYRWAAFYFPLFAQGALALGLDSDLSGAG